MLRRSAAGRAHLHAEQCFAQGLVAQRLPSIAGENDLTLLHEVDSICEFRDLRNALLDEDDAGAPTMNLADDLEHLVTELGREPERGLVERKHARVRHQP